MTERFILEAATKTGEFAGYYTGKAGEGWVADGLLNAFVYGGYSAACATQEIFNKRSALTGLLFKIEAVH